MRRLPRILLNALLLGTLACESADRLPTIAPPPPPGERAPAVAGYVLRAAGDDPSSLRLVPSREPIRGVRVDRTAGWRSIAGSKITEDQIAHYIAEDLRRPVANGVHGPVGDWDFDLRWAVGDAASVNAALSRYGLELAPAPAAVSRPAASGAR